MTDVGISNFEKKVTIKSSSNGDLKNNFVGGFASDQINYFFNFHKLIKKKKTDPKYLFVTANTDRSGQSSTHWWDILDLHLENEMIFFDTLGILGLKNFIMHEDRKLIEKRLVGIKKYQKNRKSINTGQSKI